MSDDDLKEQARVLLGSLETPTLTKAELAELLFEQVGLNKREAKDMVDGAPQTVKAGVTKEEAASMKAKLEAEGATVQIK